jgi:hypothetical protein
MAAKGSLSRRAGGGGGLMPDSPARNPERLYRERGFDDVSVCFVVFVVLVFGEIAVLTSGSTSSRP